MSRTEIALLRRVFAVILAEAERDGDLARKLAEAIGAPRRPTAPLPSAPPPTAAPPTASPKSFDVRNVHAINVLRLHGEAVLRGKLEGVRSVADLRAVAAASGLVLSGRALSRRASRAELIAAIIAAAKHYDAQRNAATA